MRVNRSQSKFLGGTRLIFQTQPDAPLFYLGKDRIAIEKLSVLGTGLDILKTQRKTTIDVSKNTCETTVAKNELKYGSSPHSHFTKYIAGVFEEPPRESN
jgi:hypothetical protein